MLQAWSSISRNIISGKNVEWLICCCAMLLKPGDPAEIVAAVEHLLARPEEASAIGERGRIKAQELFDY